MKHNWKVGDAYTTKRWENLHITGRVTKVMSHALVGQEMNFNENFTGAILDREVYRHPDDLIPLVPEPMHSGQTINELYATVDEVMCRNKETECAPPCPEHNPIDPFEGFNKNISYEGV